MKIYCQTIVILLIGSILSNSCFSQDSSTVKIKIIEYGIDFYPSKCDSIYEFNISNGEKLTVKLLDCKGEMDITFKNKNNKLIHSGHYDASLDLLKIYRTAYNASTQKKKTVVVSFYQPLRDGTWLFYNSNGKLIRKKSYSTGILNSSVEIR